MTISFSFYGWFLPALSGRPPDEVGHTDYQHPKRLHGGYYAATERI